MVPPQNVLVRRNVIVPVVELVRGRDARIIESQDFRGDERAVIAIGNGVDAKYSDEDGDGVDRDHMLFLGSGRSQLTRLPLVGGGRLQQSFILTFTELVCNQEVIAPLRKSMFR